ncbi:MAG: cobalamin biosynthesis protein CobW [Methylococcales bacterium]|jgi:cobalamin biosynthesis protein CobW|nr:cobalamin biosynthesis protein CobW [Methylococcales bacterium]MBT7442411.1 cobalamin biosynthesis protein CobW [Methylococcales bacterium]
MQLNKIPATIVTGFLGSGKTTLLSNLLKNANGKRIAVIVNEFGALDIDGELLRSCPVEGCEEGEESKSSYYQLANGCICCTVEEEFLPVMKDLVARRDDIDHILIETSGLALPKPLVKAFNWPDIKQHCTVDAVVTVIDGPAVADGRYAHNPEHVAAQRAADESLDHDPSLQELLDDQLSAADLIIVSKNDLLNDQEKQQVKSFIDHKADTAVKNIFIDHGEIDVQLVMGLEQASEDHISHVHNHHDKHHAHGHHHEHAHDHFDSHVIELGEQAPEALIQKLQTLTESMNIYRVKGFVSVPNKPMRLVIQGVGTRINQYFDRLWNSDETPKTQLVFIGKQLKKDEILQALQS